jgi:uncharacterized repeat protein (TIGR03943 family)
MNEIPVYLFTGFLDSGKTNFLMPMLTEGSFTGSDKTLLIVCEEGEEEYDEAQLAERNVRMVTVESYEELNTRYFKKLEREYRPDQVVIEYNGMWLMQDLDRELLPRNWVLYQIVVTIDATTFQMYTANMAQLMSEKLMNADLIIFNRVNDELAAMLRKRNIKMLNRRAEIYLEYENGDTTEYDSGEPPFDMTKPILELSDQDFGYWYTDVMDHPDRYEGKVVRYMGIVAQSEKFPAGSCVVGRFAMVCCENDRAFLGLICKGQQASQFKSRDWVIVTAQVREEHVDLYEGDGPMLYIQSMEPCAAPAVTDISF